MEEGVEPLGLFTRELNYDSGEIWRRISFFALPGLPQGLGALQLRDIGSSYNHYSKPCSSTGILEFILEKQMHDLAQVGAQASPSSQVGQWRTVLN